jgi:hypothetical protein
MRLETRSQDGTHTLPCCVAATTSDAVVGVLRPVIHGDDMLDHRDAVGPRDA